MGTNESTNNLPDVSFPLKGSVHPNQCKKGVSYHAIIDLPSRDGRKQVKKTFPDWTYDNPIEAAKAWLMQKNPKLGSEDHLEKVDIGVVEYLRSWHHEKQDRIRNQSIQKREWVLYKHVFPYFEGEKLQEITSFDINNFYQSKLDRLSPGSVDIFDKILTLAFNDAVRQGLIDTNPTKNVKPIPSSNHDFTVYDHGQIRRFLTAVKQYEWDHKQSYPHYPLFFTALHTGLRPGELLGLRICDLNLDEGYIQVRKSLKSDDGLYLGPPKTESSYRTVKLTDENVRVIDEYLTDREEMKDSSGMWHGSDTVFVTKTGKLIWPSTPRRKLNNVLETTSLPDITLHEFRHTHATMLLRSGVPVFNVSRRLGHASVQTTERRYLDYVPSMQKETVDKYQKSLDL